MNKLKRIIFSKPLLLILGISLGWIGSIYAANEEYSSSQVVYNNGTNNTVLSTVISDIYSKITVGDAAPGDILEGKTCLVQGQEVTGTATFDSAGTKYAIYIGQGTSFNLSSYKGYENFTDSNFLLEPVSFAEKRTTGTTNHDNDMWAGIQYTLVKQYDASTGSLTAYGKAVGEAGYENQGGRVAIQRSTVNGEVKLYLLLNSSQNTALGGNYTRKTVVYLGQGQTFDLKEYDFATGNYTANSFIVEPVNIKKTQSGTRHDDNDWWAGVRYTLVKNYNTSTKVLTTYGEARGNMGYDNSGARYEFNAIAVNGDMKTYLITN